MFKNKIAGCLFGYAIGDALGLGTEFMTRDEAKQRYPDGLRNYSQIIRDAHRSQWRKGDFTTDTRYVELLIESMVENNGIDHLHYAKKLKDWYDSGEHMDAGPHIRLVLQQSDFATHPFEVAMKIQDEQGHFEAHNEALGRAMIIGLWPDYNEENIVNNCRLTHPNPRCVASAIIISVMANELLWHKREADFDRLVGIAKRYNDEILPYLETAHRGTLSDFDLDDEDTYWYSRKAMGCALWALWHHTDPEEALYDVVSYAGDADTNAALAIGLLGLKYGLSRLPSVLIDTLLEKERIGRLADNLINLLQNAYSGKDTDE